MLIPIPSWLCFSSRRRAKTLSVPAHRKPDSSDQVRREMDGFKNRGWGISNPAEFDTLFEDLRKFFITYPHLLRKLVYPQNYAFFRHWFCDPLLALALTNRSLWTESRQADFQEQLEDLSA